MKNLFVIEGVDGSGKQTQTELLYSRFEKEGKNPLKLTFPDYESKSSTLVKMYLSGEIAKTADEVSPYVASAFFAQDRFISYKTKWGNEYQSGRVIIADRYVTSNMVHQASKIEGEAEKEKFLDWLDDFEYNIHSLPRPSKVIFLDMPPEFGRMLTKNRTDKASGTEQKDIHESDEGYINKSYENAKYIAKKYGWHIVECVRDGKLRSIEDIGNEIYKAIME